MRKNEKIMQEPVNLISTSMFAKFDVTDFVTSPGLLKFSDLTSYDNLPKFLFFHRGLYTISECDYGFYNLANINRHVSTIKSLLYNFDNKGFVDITVLDRNKIFCLFRTTFPELEFHFVKAIEGSNPSYLLFLLHHLFNIVLLFLIIDCKLTLSHYKSIKSNTTPNYELFLNPNPDPKLVAESRAADESLDDLELEAVSLTGKITTGVRQELKKRRLGFLNKIYTGFDTEFETVEVRSVDVLCYTLACYSRSYIRYRPLKIDYSIDAEGKGISSVPNFISSCVTFLVKVFRNIDEKPDAELENLKTRLDTLVDSKELERVKTSDSILYSLPRDLQRLFKDFSTLYNPDPENYSFKTLVSSTIELVEEQIVSDSNKLKKLVCELLFLNPITKSSSEKRVNKVIDLRIRKFNKLLVLEGVKDYGVAGGLKLIKISIPSKTDLTLVAHYNSADMGTLNDLEEYKSGLSILKKSFVTLSKPIRLMGLDVHIRDSSLLTVGGGSLAALGKLYKDTGLSKVEIDSK